ncbi:MAG: GNAT family N-acetyltransferase [Caulobacteraceae bacterium]
MEICSFNNLSEEQKGKIYRLVSNSNNHYSFQSFDDMLGFYGGIVLDNGKSHFSLWEGDELIGALGVISKNAGIRGEIFLVGLNISKPHSDALNLLLVKAFDYCSGIRNASYKLGITPDMAFLTPAIIKNDFKEVYRNLEMKYCGNFGTLPSDMQEHFENISSSNLKQLQDVHNRAFLLSPNGAAIEDEELEEFLGEYSGNPELAGVYFEEGKAAGIYILKMEKNVGWIEGIAVYPQRWGKGIGKKLLLKSVQVLKEARAEEIKLTVFDVNKNAVKLYLDNGFVIEREHSIWYER